MTRSPAVFGAAQRGDRGGAGDLRGVVAAAGQPGEADVAVEHDRLGLARNAGKAEPRRGLALVHHAGAGEVGILGVVHDERVEIAGIGEGVAHHLGVAQRAAALREGDGAGLLQQAELGKLLAREAARHRRHRMDAHDRRVAGAAEHEIDQRRIVDHRIGVGHGDDGGDAAGGGGAARRLQRLAVLAARLADEDAHVDEAGQHGGAAAIDDLGALRRALVARPPGPAATMRPSATSTAPRASSSRDGSTTRAW